MIAKSTEAPALDVALKTLWGASRWPGMADGEVVLTHPSWQEAYRRLDPAILEELILKRTLGISDEDIAATRGLGYAKSVREAQALLDEGAYQAAFLLRPTPVEQVREVAAAGETMPPKSTYFFPKVLTGLVFNPLS